MGQRFGDLTYDFIEWDKTKIEQEHRQFLKRVLGCIVHTSNVMRRGEIGAVPLLVDVIKRTLPYHSKIVKRVSPITKDALQFENKHNISLNFVNYV